MVKPFIRAAGAGDVEALAALNTEVQDLHFANRPDQFRPVQVHEIAAWMGVQARHRRAGIGRALVGHVVAGAREQGIDDVELQSWAFNQNAQRAFTNLGFAPKVVRFELCASLPERA